jgi:hypothetical protein
MKPGQDLLGDGGLREASVSEPSAVARAGHPKGAKPVSHW